MINFISVKPCPICGEMPGRVTQDLGRPGGHGYPGHVQFYYECECCRLLKGVPADDIYRDRADAMEFAKIKWNDKVEEVKEYIDRIYVPKVIVKNNVI
jgi:hypothetical protein